MAIQTYTDGFVYFKEAGMFVKVAVTCVSHMADHRIQSHLPYPQNHLNIQPLLRKY